MIFKDLEGIGVDLQFISIIILKIIFFFFDKFTLWLTYYKLGENSLRFSLLI